MVETRQLCDKIKTVLKHQEIPMLSIGNNAQVTSTWTFVELSGRKMFVCTKTFPLQVNLFQDLMTHGWYNHAEYQCSFDLVIHPYINVFILSTNFYWEFITVLYRRGHRSKSLASVLKEFAFHMGRWVNIFCQYSVMIWAEDGMGA